MTQKLSSSLRRVRFARLAGLVALSLAAAVAIAACGPSSAKLKTAREARYKGDPATLFAAVKAATSSGYQLAVTDDAAFMVKTEPRWYTPEGQADTTRGSNIARLQDNSINFSAIVRLVKGDGDLYTVSVEPVALRKRGLSSAPEPVDLKDPSVPGWVQGKVDSLQLGIHERLQPYAVSGATVPAMVPAGPGPTPDPAAGSASPDPSGAPPPPAPAPTP